MSNYKCKQAQMSTFHILCYSFVFKYISHISVLPCLEMSHLVCAERNRSKVITSRVVPEEPNIITDPASVPI